MGWIWGLLAIRYTIRETETTHAHCMQTYRLRHSTTGGLGVPQLRVRRVSPLTLLPLFWRDAIAEISEGKQIEFAHIIATHA